MGYKNIFVLVVLPFLEAQEDKKQSLASTSGRTMFLASKPCVNWPRIMTQTKELLDSC